MRCLHSFYLVFIYQNLEIIKVTFSRPRIGMSWIQLWLFCGQLKSLSLCPTAWLIAAMLGDSKMKGYTLLPSLIRSEV